MKTTLACLATAAFVFVCTYKPENKVDLQQIQSVLGRVESDSDTQYMHIRRMERAQEKKVYEP